MELKEQLKSLLIEDKLADYVLDLVKQDKQFMEAWAREAGWLSPEELKKQGIRKGRKEVVEWIEQTTHRTICEMLKDGILWIYTDEKNRCGYALNCNDYFTPAADAEEIDIGELVEVCKIWEEQKDMGVMGWIAKKRGIENKHWRTL